MVAYPCDYSKKQLIGCFKWVNFVVHELYLNKAAENKTSQHSSRIQWPQHSLPCPYGRSGFPGGSEGKEPACSAGDLSSIPRSGKSPGEGKGNPFQYPCLESPMDGETWQAIVHGVAESDTTEWLHFLLSFPLVPSFSILELISWDFNSHFPK